MIELKKLHQVFQTLADYNRLAIIKAIGDKECSVGELVNGIKLSQPLVSHHLKVLRESGILDTKRTGPFVYYYVRDVKILYAINLFLELTENAVDGSDRGYRFCADWIIEKFKSK